MATIKINDTRLQTARNLLQLNNFDVLRSPHS